MVNTSNTGMGKSLIADFGSVASVVSANSVSRDYNDFSIFDDVSAGKPDHSAVDVTAFTDQNFKVDAISSVDASSAAGVQGPDVTTNIDDIQKAQDNYMQADQEIKANVMAVIEDVMGPEDGKAFSAHLFPDGAPTKMQAAAVVVDPTGIAGSIYSVVNAVQEQNARFGTQETREVMDKVLNQLQEAHNQEQQQTVFDTKPPFKPPYDGYNFDDVNAKQLTDFCQRDVTQDPIMQTLEDSMDNAKAIKANEAYNEAHMGQDVEANRLAAEISSGNDDYLQTISGSSAEAEAIEQYSSSAVDMVGEGLNLPPRVGAEGIDPEFASVNAVREANAEAENNNGIELSFNQEAALQRAATTPSMMG